RLARLPHEAARTRASRAVRSVMPQRGSSCRGAGRHAAVRAGSASARGLPSTRLATHDANRRGNRRTDHVAILLGMPGTTLRLPRTIARTATRATDWGLIIVTLAS